MCSELVPGQGKQQCTAGLLVKLRPVAVAACREAKPCNHSGPCQVLSTTAAPEPVCGARLSGLLTQVPTLSKLDTNQPSLSHPKPPVPSAVVCSHSHRSKKLS